MKPFLQMMGLDSFEHLCVWAVEVCFGLAVLANIGPIASPHTVLTVSGLVFSCLYMVLWTFSLLFLRNRAGWTAFSFYARCAFWCLTGAAFAMAELFPVPAYAVYAVLSAYAGVLYGRDFHGAYLPLLFLFPAAQTAVSGFLLLRKRR